jgi:hypothetical protein|tara:strand:+ start:205 stop:450 length:246 start_codon:yes stop_codon:yes gene_type:complete
MQFPWTVIFETPEGEVGAKNVLAASAPKEALQQAAQELKYGRVLGVVKGSHADYVYGRQLLQGVTHKDQLTIPFDQEGQLL